MNFNKEKVNFEDLIVITDVDYNKNNDNKFGKLNDSFSKNFDFLLSVDKKQAKKSNFLYFFVLLFSQILNLIVLTILSKLLYNHLLSNYMAAAIIAPLFFIRKKDAKNYLSSINHNTVNLYESLSYIFYKTKGKELVNEEEANDLYEEIKKKILNDKMLNNSEEFNTKIINDFKNKTYQIKISEIFLKLI